MNQRTPLFLMSNLGAEVSRVFSLIEKGDRENALRASKRVKNIISDLFEFEEMTPRWKELEKIVDVIDSKINNLRLQIQKGDILDYFNHFAVRFMNQRD